MSVWLILFYIFNLWLSVLSDDDLTKCKYSIAYYNANFDVCELVLKAGQQLNYYTVQDARNQYEDYDIFYHFNYFQPVIEYPSTLCSSITTGYCVDYEDPDLYKNCTQFVNETYKTWVYKEKTIDSTNSECSHVNGHGENEHADFWMLFSIIYNWQAPDQLGVDPSAGIIIYSGNGDYDAQCGNEPSENQGRNAMMALALRCTDEPGTNIPDTEMVYFKKDSCEYQIFLNSIHGCPIECDRFNGKLCNSKGVCGHDYTNNIPKCFCYNGYESNSGCIDLDTSATTPGKVINPDQASTDWSHTFDINNGDDDESVAGDILYDMSVWHLNGSDFKIKDSDAEDDVYLLNFADYIDPDILPKECMKATKPCKIFDYEDNECLEYQNISNGTGVAFRWNEFKKECDLIATELEWELYDDARPARGVR